MNFSVDVTGLTDDQLQFYGWFKTESNEEFSIYWNSRYNERQVVQNGPPRFLIVDDLSDAQYMTRDSGRVFQGPQIE